LRTNPALRVDQKEEKAQALPGAEEDERVEDTSRSLASDREIGAIEASTPA
jgi:hypothetical protein